MKLKCDRAAKIVADFHTVGAIREAARANISHDEWLIREIRIQAAEAFAEGVMSILNAKKRKEKNLAKRATRRQNAKAITKSRR